MIQQILYANLDRRPDRNAWFLENMELAGVPMDMVERIPAKDWKDYDSVEDTIRAMQKDGFMINNPIIPEDKKDKSLRAVPSYLWTMLIMLDRIVRNDKVTLMLHDDASVKSWEDLTTCLSILDDYRKAPNNLSHLIALGWRHKDNQRPNICVPFGDSWTWHYGVNMPMAESIIYFPIGADRMLSLLQGARDNLIGIEHMLQDHFNNYRSFQAVHAEQFILNSGPIYPHSEDSDLWADLNPEMLQ